jgi:hypothetical protein
MNIAEKKALVAHFIAKCNEYADEKIEQYRMLLASATGFDALDIQDKIGHWTAYRTFNEYTIEELKTRELDDWFS